MKTIPTFSKLMIAVICTFLLSACGILQSPTPAPTSTPDFFSYDPSSNAPIIFAEADTYPTGAPPFLPFCNEKTTLAIWADGYVVSGTKVGWIPPQQTQDILRLLSNNGFFGTPVVQINEAGTGFLMGANLKAGTFNNQWSSEPPFYSEVQEQLRPYLSPFVPETALLFTSDENLWMVEKYMPDDIPEWPANLGFSLEDVPSEGLEITGKPVEVVWKEINHTLLVTAFREGDKMYAVSLEIPKIIAPKEFSHCW